MEPSTTGSAQALNSTTTTTDKLSLEGDGINLSTTVTLPGTSHKLRICMHVLGKQNLNSETTHGEASDFTISSGGPRLMFRREEESARNGAILNSTRDDTEDAVSQAQLNLQFLPQRLFLAALAVLFTLVVYGVGITLMQIMCVEKNLCVTATSQVESIDIRNKMERIQQVFAIIQFVFAILLLLQTVFAACYWLWTRYGPGTINTSQRSLLARRLPLWLVVSILIGHTLLLYFGGILTFVQEKEITLIPYPARYFFFWVVPYFYGRFLTLVPVPFGLLRLAIIYCGRPVFTTRGISWLLPISLGNVRAWAVWAPRVYFIANLVYITVLVGMETYSVVSDTKRMWGTFLTHGLHTFIYINISIDAGLVVLLWLLRHQLKQHHLDQSRVLMFLSVIATITYTLAYLDRSIDTPATSVLTKIFRIIHAISASVYLLHTVYLYQRAKGKHTSLLSNAPMPAVVVVTVGSHGSDVHSEDLRLQHV